MKVTMKDGQLYPLMAKAESTILEKAAQICLTIATVEPKAEETTTAANAAAVALLQTIQHCGKKAIDAVDRPLLDAIEAQGVGEPDGQPDSFAS